MAGRGIHEETSCWLLWLQLQLQLDFEYICSEKWGTSLKRQRHWAWHKNFFLFYYTDFGIMILNQKGSQSHCKTRTCMRPTVLLWWTALCLMLSGEIKSPRRHENSTYHAPLSPLITVIAVTSSQTKNGRFTYHMCTQSQTHACIHVPKTTFIRPSAWLRFAEIQAGGGRGVSEWLCFWAVRCAELSFSVL